MFEPEPHVDFVFIVENAWPGAIFIMGLLAIAVVAWLWLRDRRRRRDAE